jgi:hypothetical protein
MKPTDPIQITQLEHGTKLQKGEVWTFLDATEGEPATRAYGQAITLARIVFGPRWRSVAGPNLSESAFEEMLHRIVFEWLFFYAINKKPIVVTPDDLTHPYAWRRVRTATGIALGARTSAANQLAAHLLNMELSRYEWWLEQEDKMDEVR